MIVAGCGQGKRNFTWSEEAKRSSLSIQVAWQVQACLATGF